MPVQSEVFSFSGLLVPRVPMSVLFSNQVRGYVSCSEYTLIRYALDDCNTEFVRAVWSCFTIVIGSICPVVFGRFDRL